MDTRLIPECYLDTALIEVLGYPSPSHQQNNSNVLKALDAKGYNNTVGIGVIDRDKTQPKKLETEYSLVKKVGDISIYRKDDSKRFVIVHPNIEKWILEVGEKADVSPEDYGVPSDLKALKSISKSAKIQSNPNVRNYINALKMRDTAIKKLKELIEETLKL
ncbi:MAG: hypothetical protein EAY81_06270 [Bacteroidetes bacterium]|nr:MAG: hypothetical protein EAY81_06270 [Bacteroidota bacterium]